MKTQTKPASKAKPAVAIDAHHQGQYRIAAVSKLTGMPVPTLHMWERRHAVVAPARSSGNGRLYSRADVDRLILLKAATDSGHAISTVAPLSETQLRARLQEQPSKRALLPSSNCRVLVCGNVLAERLQESWVARNDIRIVSTLGSLTSAVPASAPTADAVIVEAPTLQLASTRALLQLRLQTSARVMIVVYGFANRNTLMRLDQEGIIAVASPTEAAHLARICHLGLGMEVPTATGTSAQLMQPAAFRRYDESFLAAMAQLPTSVRCECPNHLAELLTKLNAFEHYSLECENADAADASIHSLLYAAASQCRALLEHALSRVLEHEGIADPTHAPAAAAKASPALKAARR